MTDTEHEPTDATRRRVVTMISLGRTPFEIATSLEISMKLLRVHYGRELKNGRAITEAESLEQLQNEARNGDAKSARALARLLRSKGIKPKPKKKKWDEPSPVVLNNREVALTGHLGTAWEQFLPHLKVPRALLEKLAVAFIDGVWVEQHMVDRARQLLAEMNAKKRSPRSGGNDHDDDDQ